MSHTQSLSTISEMMTKKLELFYFYREQVRVKVVSLFRVWGKAVQDTTRRSLLYYSIESSLKKYKNSNIYETKANEFGMVNLEELGRLPMILRNKQNKS